MNNHRQDSVFSAPMPIEISNQLQTVMHVIPLRKEAYFYRIKQIRIVDMEFHFSNETLHYETA